MFADCQVRFMFGDDDEAACLTLRKEFLRQRRRLPFAVSFFFISPPLCLSHLKTLFLSLYTDPFDDFITRQLYQLLNTVLALKCTLLQFRHHLLPPTYSTNISHKLMSLIIIWIETRWQKLILFFNKTLCVKGNYVNFVTQGKFKCLLQVLGRIICTFIV